MLKPPGVISVDCDSVSDYLATYNYPFSPPPSDPTYTEGLPRLLDILDKHRVRGTFFLVGRETQKRTHRAIIQRIAESGHEIANHTMNHPPNFGALPREVKIQEIENMARAAEDITGQKVVGFRAPVYWIDRVTMDLLEERGYLYDSSIYPSFFFPLQQAIIRWKAWNKRSKIQWGNALWNFSPKGPFRPHERYIWLKGNRNIIEIPISVVPFLNLPFYGTFVLFSGTLYFRVGLGLIRRFTKQMVFQYHPIELLGLEDGVDPRLNRLPGLKKGAKEKMEMIDSCVGLMAHHFDLRPARELAGSYLEERKMSVG